MALEEMMYDVRNIADIGGIGMNPYLNRYVSLVDFLADAFGRNTEVILHDVTDCANSVVAIRNGHISGRKKGSPLTDLGLKILKEASETNTEYMAGYIGYARDGSMTKSSTWIIRDDTGKIAGMLCVNTDCTDIKNMQDALKSFADKMELPLLPQTDSKVEHFNMNVSDLVDNNLKKVWSGYGSEHPKLTQKEKVEIVSKLNDMGTFYMKGSVACVADRIGSSIPTVYRYLNAMKKN